MEAGRVAFLHGQLGLLPEETVKRRPWLLLYQAETLDIEGEFDQAIGLYREAAALFGKSGEDEPGVLALLLSARLLDTVGRHGEAEAAVEEVRLLTPEGSPYWHVLTAFKSITSSLTGISDIAERCLADALEHAGEIEDEAARASLLYWCGFSAFLQSEYHRAREILTVSCELAERNNLTAILLQLYVFLSQTDLLLGRQDEALLYSDRGLSLLARLGAENPLTVACRSNRAGALLASGSYGEALREIETAVELSGRFEPSIETFNNEVMAGWVHWTCGDRGEGYSHFEQAVRVAVEIGFIEAELFARGLVIYASIERTGLDAARESVLALLETPTGPGVGPKYLFGRLLLAYVELMADNVDEAVDAVDVAAELIDRYGGLGWWEGMWRGCGDPSPALPLLTDIFGRGAHLDILGHAFREIGSPSLPYLARLASSRNPGVSASASRLLQEMGGGAAEPLRVRMLGTFEVERGGRRISAGEWKSSRALSVLKYLASQPAGRLVPRDVLMELLWPDSTPESASKNLNTALTALRKTLEPDSPRGGSSYLLSQGDSLRLELGEGGWVDSHLFRDRVREADEARAGGDGDLLLENLLEADALYRGDFLSEDPYEDWCVGEREELKEERSRLLCDISSEYLRREEYEQARRYSEKAVGSDPGRESLYRSLMEICSLMGDRSGVERAFSRCSTYLEENYTVSPSRETVELYRRLRGG